jgi:hypothetical protein
MDAAMKARPNRIHLPCLALLLLMAAGTAGAQNIYKCTRDGQVSYTDHPCPKGGGELLHQADDTEIIDRYLRLGQDKLAKSYADSHHLEALYQQRIEARQQAQDEKEQRQADDTAVIDRYLRLGQDKLAKSYADSHHLEALYQQRIEARQQAQDEKEQRQADEAYAAQQRAEQERQQALVDEAAERNRLQGENEVLRQQNDAYQDQLQQQQAYNPPPAYWVPYPNRRPGRDHDHDHHGDGDGHHRPPPKEPVFHPCKQLAGGRVQC